MHMRIFSILFDFVSYKIDFVVNKGMYQYYIQSAYSLENDEKRRRELYPLSITGNSVKKIVVTSHELRPHYDENGIFPCRNS